MSSFTVSKNGYYLYTPSWQQNPGARMREMNRAAAQSYYDNFSTLGGNLLSATVDFTASSVELYTQIATQRVQSEYQTKLAAATSSLNGLSSLDLSI